MSHLPTVLLMTPKKIEIVSVAGLLLVGGEQSTGVKLAGLKQKDDYVVLTPQGASLLAHPMKGKQSGVVQLNPLDKLEISDLSIVLLPPDFEKNMDSSGSQSDLISPILQTMNSLSRAEDMEVCLHDLLSTVLSTFAFEKGVLVTKKNENEFQVTTSQGVSGNEPWLSETLVQNTMKSKSGIQIKNIVGSNYESNKSIVATGFLSVFSWPLAIRGEVLGVLILGSTKPHSGLSPNQTQEIEVFVQLAALALTFYLRDLKLKSEVAALKAKFNSNDCPLLTEADDLKKTIRIAHQIAPTDLSVYIFGETGVGKEVLANWIHQQSDRKSLPFVAVNCGAIPAELLESILFGHAKGAFTGAHNDQVGKFVLANGGTIFLDEIGDLPLHLQVKLLRVLQEKVVEPVGSSKKTKVNVRILSASHKNIHEMMKQGLFRDDLFYRLAEITIEIPPLRTRPKDIGLLATNFLNEMCPEKRFSLKAWNWLEQQPWNGNVRELKSAIKRASVLSLGPEIQQNDFVIGAPHMSQSTDSRGEGWLGGKDLEQAKINFVQAKIHQALEMSGGVKTQAAELLGITPRTLYRYLEDRISSESDQNLSEV